MKNTLSHMHASHILVLKKVLEKKSLSPEKRRLIESEIQRHRLQMENSENNVNERKH